MHFPGFTLFPYSKQMGEVLKYKVLVAEELHIVNFEIRQKLKNYGFGVLERSGKGDVLKLVKDRTPDFTITCLRSLRGLMPVKDFYEIWGRGLIWSGITDTIIFDKSMNPLAFYPKPYDSNEIMNFFVKHLT